MAKGKRKDKGGGKKPLDGSASHLLHRVLQIALDVYAEETGPGALTQRQFAVLAAVAENEGLTQTDLVNATGIDRSTLADLVARMLGKGLLERERSSTDGRANAVRLAEAGRAALAEARPRVEAADKRILGLVPGGKRGSLMKVLGEMARKGEAAKSEASDKAIRKADKARRKAEKKLKPKKVKPAKPASKPEPEPNSAAAPAKPAKPDTPAKSTSKAKARRSAKPVKKAAARPKIPTAKPEEPAAS